MAVRIKGPSHFKKTEWTRRTSNLPKQHAAENMVYDDHENGYC